MNQNSRCNCICRLFLTSAHNFQSARQNFKGDFAQIAAKAGEDFAVGMDIKRTVGNHREFLAGAHADLFCEATMCATHELGHESEHHGARNFSDEQEFHDAIRHFRIRRKHKTAALTSAIAKCGH